MNAALALMVIVGIMLVMGCSNTPQVEYREVLVPTPTLPELPEALKTTVLVRVPTFVEPDNPKAVAALTLEQTLIFKHWMVQFKAQLVGFRALFNLQDEPPEPVGPD